MNMITRRNFLKYGAGASAALARRWNRGRHSERNESVRLHAAGNRTTTASQPAANAVLGLRRRFGTWWASRFVRDGGGRREWHADRCQLHQCVAIHIPGLDSG